MDIDKKTRLVIQKAREDPVFFAETFLIGPNGKPFQLEEHQKRILRDRHPNKVILCSRRSGKSLILVIDGLYKAFFYPNRKIFFLSPTQQQSFELASTLDEIVTRSKLLQPSFDIYNKTSKILDNGSRIYFRSAGTASGKKSDSSLIGSSITDLVLDEAQSVDKEAFELILPAVLGQSYKPSITFIGTSRGASLLEDQKENCSHLYEDGKVTELDPTKNFHLHRFIICECDDNFNVIRSKTPRISIEDLEMTKRVIGLSAFRQEFLLDVVESATMPYPKSLIRESGILAPPASFTSRLPCYAGLDLAKTRNKTVLTIAEFNRPARRYDVKYFKSFEVGTTYKAQTHYLTSVLPKRFPNLIALAIDQTGVGNAIVERLEHQTPYALIPVIFSQPKKVELVENSVEMMEMGKIAFYQEPTLIEEFSTYTREVTEAGRTIFKKGASDDYIDSFNLCNYAIAASTLEISNPPFIGNLGTKTFEKSSINRDKRSRIKGWLKW